MIDFNFISSTLYNTRDFNFKVRKLIEGVCSLITDLYGCTINDSDIAVRVDQLSYNLASTPVSFCGHNIGTLTWRYDSYHENWCLCGVQDLERLFVEFKRDLEHFNTEFYESALLHILANNYTTLED